MQKEKKEIFHLKEYVFKFYDGFLPYYHKLCVHLVCTLLHCGCRGEIKF